MTKRIIAPLILTILLTACGAPSIAALRGTIAGFAPLVAVLVSQGKISPEKAAIYTADANKLADAFGVLSANFKGTNTDKAEALRVFANTVAPISTDFGRVPQLAIAMAILNTTISVIEAFYSPTTVPGVSAGVPRTEKDLKGYIDRQKRALQTALAH